MRFAVQQALSGEFKVFSIGIELIPEYERLIAPISKENVSLSFKDDYNTLTLNILAYSLLDVQKVVELKIWTLQALLYEYTQQHFTVKTINVCDSEFNVPDTACVNYDYSWMDHSDIPLTEDGKIIIPEECLSLIFNLFSDQIKDLDVLLLNSARILLTGHQMESRMEYLNTPGITDVINSTAISSIEPLAYFINRQEGQCDKCGNKTFSIVSKIKALLTKYMNDSFATYYCKTYYSDRSKLFHQGHTKATYARYETSYPILDPSDPQKILMPSSVVDPCLFDWSSYIFRNMIHEYYTGSLSIKGKAGEEFLLSTFSNTP